MLGSEMGAQSMGNFDDAKAQSIGAAPAPSWEISTGRDYLVRNISTFVALLIPMLEQWGLI
jgi:hypothetical protein